MAMGLVPCKGLEARPEYSPGLGRGLVFPQTSHPTAPTKKKRRLFRTAFSWSGRLDLNQRLLDPQSNPTPTCNTLKSH